MTVYIYIYIYVYIHIYISEYIWPVSVLRLSPLRFAGPAFPGNFPMPMDTRIPPLNISHLGVE